MNYLVRWLQFALDRLAALWLAASSADRQRITDATNRVDQLLRGNPHGVGESRSARKRIAFIRPLVIDFRVEQDDKTVTVIDVRFLRGGQS